jgi:hypothetical protein
MNEEQLLRMAYLYGRSREKLIHIRDDLSVYQGYIALSKSLWHLLKANDAIHENGNLKAQYIHAMEAGRDSVIR